MNISMPAQDCLLLPPAMTIENIEAIAAEYKQFPLKEKMQLKIDASQLEALTTPGAQLLLSFEKSLSLLGGNMVIEHASPAVRQTLSTLGLTHLLPEPA
jgi:anti-anti-sigma regulatory factor